MSEKVYAVIWPVLEITSLNVFLLEYFLILVLIFNTYGKQFKEKPSKKYVWFHVVYVDKKEYCSLHEMTTPQQFVLS